MPHCAHWFGLCRNVRAERMAIPDWFYYARNALSGRLRLIMEHDETVQRARRDRKGAAFAVAEFDKGGIRIQPLDYGADLAAR